MVSVKGDANELIKANTLWGIQRVSSQTIWKDKIDLPKPRWPSGPDRSIHQEKKQKDLRDKLAHAESLPMVERIGEWAKLEAKEPLWNLTPASLPALVERIASDRFDEYVFLRAVIANFGASIGPILQEAYRTAQGTRKAQILSSMAFCSPKDMIKPIQAALHDSDWRLRRGAVGVLGYWFDQDQGHAPGRLYFMTFNDQALRVGHEKYLPDVLAIAALKPDLSTAERLALAQSQEQIGTTLSAKGWSLYAAILKTHANFYRRIFKEETETAKTLRKLFLPRVQIHFSFLVERQSPLARSRRHCPRKARPKGPPCYQCRAQIPQHTHAPHGNHGRVAILGPSH